MSRASPCPRSGEFAKAVMVGLMAWLPALAVPRTDDRRSSRHAAPLGKIDKTVCHGHASSFLLQRARKRLSAAVGGRRWGMTMSTWKPGRGLLGPLAPLLGEWVSPPEAQESQAPAVCRRVIRKFGSGWIE